MNFNIGDIVKVKNNLVARTVIGGVYCASEMVEYGGKQLRVCRVNNNHNNVYKLSYSNGKDTGYHWSAEMLEDVK